MAEQEYTDEYFINLTMDYDHRDDNIYPKWAVWCAKSNDRYYIDGKDHHFYTHVRTDEEIAIERKKREIMEFSFSQREGLEPMEIDSPEWKEFMDYEGYLHDLIRDDASILEVTPMTFVEWKASKEPAE